MCNQTDSAQPLPAPCRRVELLSPAGQLDAAYAALQYGADAVYCGLRQFSARAEAANLSLDEFGEVVGYAHSLSPRRRVFATINTVVLNRELPAVLDTLAALAEVGADAVIVQDLGVFRMLRRYVPGIEVHASTQMAVHNLAGARTLARLGFRRVTLARELTLGEVRDIAASAGVETEVFIHGALCYAYSGLCQFSSHLRGRSGNRGRCAYPCRDVFRPARAARGEGDPPDASGPEPLFPFSMKDLALPGEAADLRAAGVACLKIEGRMKSPLYVAAVTDLYRRVLDGRLSAGEQKEAEADLKTIFSRPWTSLYIRSNRRCDAVDPHWVGHRGVRIGTVEAVLPPGRSAARIRFRSARPIERHDGLQVDIPGRARPFGFPVDSLRIVSDGKGAGARRVFEASAGAVVEVELPADHPAIPSGSALYCSSSQAVKRRFGFTRPRPGEHRARRPADIAIEVEPHRVAARATVRAAGCADISVRAEAAGERPFQGARDSAALESAARAAFEKCGGTDLRVGGFEFKNPAGCFVPVSLLNGLRRELYARAVEECARQRREDREQLRRDLVPVELGGAAPPAPGAPQWSLKTDRVALLDAFADDELRDVGEVIVEIDRDPLPRLLEGLAALAARAPQLAIRLALPLVTRQWEVRGIAQKIAALREAGWRKWEAANLSAWEFLGVDPTPGSRREGGPDLAADWSVYVLNRMAARQALDMGASGFTLSPEDGWENLRSLLREFGAAATVVVYQDTPLFISESCAWAGLRQRCAGASRCRFDGLDLDSSRGEAITVANRHCRTTAFSRSPFCLADRMAELVAGGARRVRADFVCRPYTAAEGTRIWRLLRTGAAPAGCHAGNFARGLA